MSSSERINAYARIPIARSELQENRFSKNLDIGIFRKELNMIMSKCIKIKIWIHEVIKHQKNCRTPRLPDVLRTTHSVLRILQPFTASTRCSQTLLSLYATTLSKDVPPHLTLSPHRRFSSSFSVSE